MNYCFNFRDSGSKSKGFSKNVRVVWHRLCFSNGRITRDCLHLRRWLRWVVALRRIFFVFS